MSSIEKRARRFRLVFLVIHVLIAATFSVLVTVGVVRGLTSLRAPRPAPPMAVEACLAKVDDLRSELLDRLAAFPRSASAAEEADAFGPWAMDFRGRFVAARAPCKPPAGADKEEAKAVAEAFEAIRRALNLSEIQATHWSRHLGPALDESAEALRKARSAAR